MPEKLSRITPPSSILEESAKSSMAEKVLLILEKIAQSEFPLTLEAISTSTGLAKPTAFRLLNTLVTQGFVERDPNGRRFQPSAKLRIMGINILSVDSIRSQRVAVMKRLVEEIGETCNFNILDGNKVMYLDRVETSAPIRLHVDLGMRVPLHCTASGKLFLSGMTHLQIRRSLGAEPFERYTDRTIIDYNSLFFELEKIRGDGYAIDDSAYLDGFIGIAVPVVNLKNKTFATITAHGPAPRMQVNAINFYLEPLKRAAQDIQNTISESIN
ncbi:MAG: IclR family transcriptional regulator [Polynucleobacter sp.]|uniref:IclR family transcriptional regulator n=1 Tax=Polynucleobacter sp. TaxID=2029855 RepID=UPI00271A2D89|nr:IclR family transcriptional regulator [Polynucleobacter sp.]MDO8713497.1 IclR family transcriptional regulator [Polynucleobacter sp.]